jgi:endonuclease/exonuclease/phosphatase family metal-dependent hydrolase
MVTQAQPSIPFVESHDQQLEHGNFSSSTSGPAPSKLVIATFNIRYAVGSFLITGSLLRRFGLRLPRRRSAVVLRHIEEAALALSTGTSMPRVDILALQEADKETVRAGNVHVAKELARKLQMCFVHAALNIPRGKEQKPNRWYLDFEEHIATTDNGDTGLAVLSRFPIVDATRVELPWSDCEWRPRLALETTFSVGRNTLRVYNAHIDPHANTDDQLEQHRKIIELAEKAAGPTVLLGDFNTLTSESRLRMRGLLETHGFTTPFPNGLATWRAGLIRLQPDWIFVRDVKVARCGVTRGLSVSDHWPVWAEIVIDS